MKKLSVIVVSYNTRDITQKCLLSLQSNFRKRPISYEIIVVDNASSDGTRDLLKGLSKKIDNFKLILNRKNLGFGKANNLGLKQSDGEFILYLNTDTIVKDIDFEELLSIFKVYPKVGVLTVKVVLPNGLIDPASHRGFPTIWRSFCYFSGLEKIFTNFPFLNKFFGGYHLTYLDLNTIHEIDSPTGAFYLAKKNILQEIGGFDEDFFMYGEDLDMSYKIKKLKYKIIYYPLYKATHLKSISGLKKQQKAIKSKTKDYFYQSMKIFYRKHYATKNLWLTNQLIYFLIDLKKQVSR